MDMIDTVKALSHDGMIDIATAGSRKETSWKNQRVKWSQLLAKLAKVNHTAETLEQYKALPKDDQDQIKDVGGFVGGTLREGRRRAGYVSGRSLITLDLDEAKPETLLNVELALDGIAYAVYSTHKHTPEKPRLRVVVPVEGGMTAEEYEPCARRIGELVGLEQCDDTTFEAVRLMYWPSTSVDGQYIFTYSDEPWIRKEELLSRYADWRDASFWPASERAAKDLKRAIKRAGNPLEKPGLIGAFCRVYPVTAAIDEFLLDVYAPVGDGRRYTYLQGSTAGGLVIYDNDTFAYSNHGTDPAGGRAMNAFELVRVHLFGEEDVECSPDLPVNRLPSVARMHEFCLAIPEVKRENLAAAAGSAADAFDAEGELDERGRPSWLSKLQTTDKGLILNTSMNVVIVLENDPKLVGKFAYNELLRGIEITGALPWEPGAERRACTDEDEAALRIYLENEYKLDKREKIRDALVYVSMRASYHPVRDYLAALVWDGVERLDTALVTWLGAEDTAITRAFTRKAFAAAVGRVYQPGVKFDQLLVLIGPQGAGKSTFLKKMGMEWFSDSLYTMEGKDAFESLQGKWIVEMGELMATKRSDQEAHKLFLSKSTDRYRPAYGRYTVEQPRQCIIIGTTNNREFLQDRTGNRRYWPVTISNTRKAQTMTQADVDQLWAEAKVRWMAGEKLYVEDSQIAEAVMALQEEHLEDDGKRGQIVEFLNRPIPEGWDKMDADARRDYWAGFVTYPVLVKRLRVCAMEILVEHFGMKYKDIKMYDSRYVSEILRSLPDWTYVGVQRAGSDYGSQRSYGRVTKR